MECEGGAGCTGEGHHHRRWISRGAGGSSLPRGLMVIGGSPSLMVVPPLRWWLSSSPLVAPSHCGGLIVAVGGSPCC